MRRFPHPNKKTLFILLLVVAAMAVAAVTYVVYVRVEKLNTAVGMLSKQLEQQEQAHQQTLYEDHLQLSEKIKLESQIVDLEQQISTLTQKNENQEYLQLQEVYNLYSSINSKLSRNAEVGLDTSLYSNRIAGLGELLLDKDYAELSSQMQIVINDLDKNYEDYLASLPPPEPEPTSTSSLEGYEYVTVSTEKGSFSVHLVKKPLSDVRVVTSAASSGDCDNNCPAKPLESHVRDSGGFAGINAGYFCPPDYTSCAGNVNSTDFAFYKTSTGTWLNEDALTWGKTGLATFKEHSATFYRASSGYSGQAVDAGVSNYPTLMYNGDIVVDLGDLTSYQTDVRGPRGVIAVTGNDALLLAIVSNATVPEAAYAIRELGAKHALNLDGGGSSALYINGSYVVGPGRQLPNAVVLIR